MLFEEFRSKYFLSDGQVLTMSTDFEKKEISLRLNAQKLSGKKTERCEIILHLKEAFELDIVETLDMGWHTDVVFVQLEPNKYYISFDPFGNSGLPHESDNFVIKCRAIEFFHEGQAHRLE